MTSVRAARTRARGTPPTPSGRGALRPVTRLRRAGFALTGTLPGIDSPVMLLRGRPDPLLSVLTDGRRACRSPPPGVV